MTAGQPMNARRAASLVVEVADAVAELHAHGVAHGGISQPAVLVTMKGKAKLDRIADPTLSSHAATAGDDLVALGELLADLAGRPGTTGGVVGAAGDRSPRHPRPRGQIRLRRDLRRASPPRVKRRP